METKEVTKIEALAKHLKCSVDKISENGANNMFDVSSQEYLVLTDDEAQERATEDIENSLWAFRAEFLESYMPEGVEADTIKIIQEKCEDANPAIMQLIQWNLRSGPENLLLNQMHFINDAIMSDGRGHFISHYDGEEIEAGEYFIYRLN